MSDLSIIPAPRLKSCALAVQLVMSKLSHLNVKAFGIATLSVTTGAFAQQAIDIKSKPLAYAVKEFAQKTGVQIGYDANIMLGKKSRDVKGTLTIDEALQKLLSGSGLTAIKQANNSYVLKKFSDSADNNRVAGTLALTTVGSENSFGDAPAEQGGFKADYQKTATKMAMKIKDTPQAISVVTRDALDARMVTDLASGTALVAGLGEIGGPSIFGGKSEREDWVVLRGQELDAQDIKIDGFSNGALVMPDFAVVERIEVVKGPSGFYGQGSLAGYINMVRKKPQQEFSADISASVGSYDTYRAEGNITGALTEDKNLLGHLTFAYTDEGSFTDGINTKGVVVAPSIEARINDNTRVLLQLLYQEEAFDQNPGIPAKIEGDRIVPYDVSRSFLFGALGDEKSKTELLDANLKIDHQFSDDWLASLLLQKSQQTRDLIHANAGYAYYTPDPVVDIDHSNTEEEIDRWAGELRLEGNFSAFGQEQQVLLGLEQNQQDKVRGWGNYTQYGVVNIYTDNFADAGIFSRVDVPITDIDTSKVANEAVYAQTMLTLHERTKLLVSARYDRAEQTSSGFDETVENEEVTYRIGLTQTFTENINAYANYGQSFNPVLKKGENNSILEPETGEAYELGLKTYWFDSKFGANLAIYRQELTNRPVTDPDSIGPGKDGYSMSAGLHRTDGVELELTGSPYPGLTVAAAATWMDNEFLDSKDSFYGLSLHGSVDNRFSLYANYELQSGALKGLGLGTTLQSVNDRNHDTWFDGEKSTDDYKLLDIHLSYNALRNWNISLLIHNIFDEKYLKSLDTPYQANYFGAPRSVLLKATYHFD